MGCDLDGIAWALELDGFLSLCLIAVWLWVSYLTSPNPVDSRAKLKIIVLILWKDGCRGYGIMVWSQTAQVDCRSHVSPAV